MKFEDIEVGKEYAVKYGRSGAVRETCIEKYPPLTYPISLNG